MDRDEPRHDRDGDAGGADAVEIAEIDLVIEEELGDGARGAGVDLRLQHVDIGLDGGRLRVLLGIAGDRNLERRDLLDAADLTAGIKQIAPFEFSFAGYPEKHPESPSVEADIDMLKAKIDAGATGAISQFFFDNEVYFRYLDRVRAAGITIPIVPGLIPIHNFKQVSNFAERSGAKMPDWIGHRFEGLDEDQETRHLVAAAVAAEQVLGLVDQGITEFHFYTLNRADLVYAICHLLGLRPAKAFTQAKVETAT